MATQAPMDFSGLPEGFGIDQQDIARKRAALQAQLAQVMAVGVPKYKRRGLAVVADMLTQSKAKSGLEELDKKESAARAQYSQGDRAGLAELLAGMGPRSVPQAGPPVPTEDGMPGAPLPNIQQPGDPRAAIAKALTSPFAKTQAMGGQLMKSQQENFKAALTAGGERLDIGSILNATRNGGDPAALSAAPPMAPPTVTELIPGQPAIQTMNRKGEPHIQFPPKPLIGSINNGNTANKAGTEILEKQGVDLATGKSFEKSEAATKALSATQEVLQTLANNPQMGAGAEAFQTMRKWYSTLTGKPVETTTPSEMAAMQLGQAVLARLEGLGAGISNDDRKFMMQTQGSIGNDPEAVRKLLMIEAKYLMQAQTRYNSRVEPVNQRLNGVAAIPPAMFNFTIPDKFGEEFGGLMEGRGFMPPSLAQPGRIKRRP